MRSANYMDAIPANSAHPSSSQVSRLDLRLSLELSLGEHRARRGWRGARRGGKRLAIRLPLLVDLVQPDQLVRHTFKNSQKQSTESHRKRANVSHTQCSPPRPQRARRRRIRPRELTAELGENTLHERRSGTGLFLRLDDQPLAQALQEQAQAPENRTSR